MPDIVRKLTKIDPNFALDMSIFPGAHFLEMFFKTKGPGPAHGLGPMGLAFLSALFSALFYFGPYFGPYFRSYFYGPFFRPYFYRPYSRPYLSGVGWPYFFRGPSSHLIL